MRLYTKVLQDVRALGAQYNDARAAAYKRDPDLTPEGQTKAVAAKTEQAQATFGPQFDAALARAEEERAAALARAAKVRPTVKPDDMAAMVRTEQAWTHLVRPALENGHTLAEVLANAGPDEVLGAERFAGSWLAMQARPGDSTDYRSLARQEVTQALARLAPTPADGEAILDGEAADREFAALRQVVGYTREGRTLEAALAVQYAGLPQSAAEASDGGGEAA